MQSSGQSNTELTLSRIKILVYGFYSKGNFGDDLFVDAFKKLFPEFEFTFTDTIETEPLLNTDAVFFGGGSFLFAEPNITSEAFELLKSKKLFYIGMGGETSIHPKHLELMKRAQLIAIRSPESLEKIKAINSNTVCIPDIVYSLPVSQTKSERKQKSVLVFPNMEVVSKHSDPAWKHTAWEYFKSEFSQFLDVISGHGYTISFLPFCKSNIMNDNWAATEIMNKMNHRNVDSLLDKSFSGIDSAVDFFSQYDLIITQRFHGIVLAEMSRVPYISIHHHDKLKNAYPSEGTKLSYYSLNKDMLMEKFNSTINMKFTSILPIETNLFVELQARVRKIITGG